MHPFNVIRCAAIGMQMSAGFLEGYFIMTDDDCIFEVKGDLHPVDRVIAYLRYIPSKNGDRCSSGGVRYKKVYSLQERELSLSEKYPHYLWHDERHGRVLQSVPINRIAFVLNPVVCMSQMRDMSTHLDNLQKASLKLASLLVEKAGVSWLDVGITGSQLAGLALVNSDIDLVVYGSKPARKVFRLLRDRGESFGIKRYSGKKLEDHVTFRWGRENAWWQLMKRIEAKKVLQGEFGSYDFFIRNVKLPEERAYSYEDLSYANEGIQKIQGKITDSQDSIFTPCRYRIESAESPMFRQIVSYRGKFTEQAEEGMIFEAKGRAESVRVKGIGEEFMQLVLGEDPADYLIPVL
jgi:predicted nucleotidyltransferase